MVTMHEAASFAQRNCDVIQNGAEKMNGRPIERENTGQLSLACTGHLRDHRCPRRLGSVLSSSNAIFILLSFSVVFLWLLGHLKLPLGPL